MEQNSDINSMNQLQEKLSKINLLTPPNSNTGSPKYSCSQKPFIGKLIEILNDESNSNIISWNYSGTSFIVKDPDAFSQVILPKYFKSNNFNSFVRQVNMYNFHKVKNANFKGANCNPVYEFENENFIRDKPYLLNNIKRKVNERDDDIQEQFYDLQKKYSDLYAYVKILQESLFKVIEDNRNLTSMLENLKIYMDKKIDYTDKKIEYTDKKINNFIKVQNNNMNNNLLNIPENIYSNNISSSNENYATRSPYILGINGKLQEIPSPSFNLSPSINSVNSINSISTIDSPLISLVPSIIENNNNDINSDNVNPIIINASNINLENLNSNYGNNIENQYLGLGNTEYRCLSPVNSDLSEEIYSNQSGIAYIENFKE